jgi:hypothetical protein
MKKRLEAGRRFSKRKSITEMNGGQGQLKSPVLQLDCLDGGYSRRWIIDRQESGTGRGYSFLVDGKAGAW